VLDWLTNTPYAVWARESLWGWPLALTFHAFGTAAIIGLFFIIGLRLVGLFRTIPYTSLNKLFPIIWISVVIQALSGFSLWMTKPDRYVADGVFLAKFSLVVIGVVVTRYFQNTLNREASAWEIKGAVSSRGLKLVVAAVLLWASVLVAGRLTAYLGSLYAALGSIYAALGACPSIRKSPSPAE
jgi:hypothetical protein